MTTAISPSARFRVNHPSVVNETINGEAVIINLAAGIYYSADNVGSLIWGCVEQSTSIAQIIEVVCKQYIGDKALIAGSVLDFITQLAEERLIVATDQNTGTSANLAPDTAASRPYEAPVLHRYADMQELLMLDPIHDVDNTGWPIANGN